MRVVKEELLYFTYFNNKTAVVGNINKQSSPRAVDDCKEVEGKNVTIPSTITVNNTEYIVTSLYDNAFYSCKITSIELPETLKSIGRSSLDTTHITNDLKLPESLEFIGDWAISAADFDLISIPSSVSHIGNGAIGCNSNLIQIKLSPTNPYFTFDNGILYDNSYTTIIQAISTIENVTIKDSVRVIQAAAFSYTKISELIIPSTVKKLINKLLILAKI